MTHFLRHPSGGRIKFTPCGDCGAMCKIEYDSAGGTHMEWNVSSHLARLWHQSWRLEGFKVMEE